jgi:beta-lactamase regulating signal transducer with metallopeptidase domain
MNTILGLERALEWLLERSWQAAVLVGCVLALQWLLRRQLTNRWRSALWWVVLARLILPVGPESACSLFNCFRAVPTAAWVTPQPKPAPLPPAAIVPPLNGSSSAAPSIPAVEPRPNVEPSRAPRPANKAAAAARRPARMSPRELVLLGVGACWLTGVLVFGACGAMQVEQFKRRLARTATPADSRLREVFARCQEESGLRRAIEIWETEAVNSPALFGVFRLRLLLPRGMAQQFDGEELRFIFLHELAHVRRGDLWLNWLVTGLQVAHWFNPVIWLGFARLRADRELACDELALRQTGEAAAEAYGNTIIKLLEGWHRPAMPGLVGILEDKQQMRRRILRIASFRKASQWSALAALLVLALGVLALTDAQPGRPDLTGRVEDQSGQPVRATVLIATAAPKVGVGVFCPSCYADCRKRLKADAGGQFKIGSLDPELVFQVVAVAPGFQPGFVAKVDPTNGPIKIRLKPISQVAAPPENCVHGRVVDTGGKVIADAVVENLGGGDGMDLVAVSNEQGEFLMTSATPRGQFLVKISARGYAPRNAIDLAAGTGVREVVLSEGASLSGRVLRDGKPLKNFKLGVVSTTRIAQFFAGPFEIGTTADGRFTFANLPPEVNYFVYGLMESQGALGALPVRLFRSGKDGSMTDLGNLAVAPGYRLAGRVVSAGNKPLPPTSRLVIERGKAWDRVVINLPSDGRFAVSNFPAESYSLRPIVPGYRPSPDNASPDPLGPFLYQDMTNLTVLLEPEESLPSQSRHAAVLDSPASGPLSGGPEPIPARWQKWVVAGRLTDRQTGRPIPQFRVTPGEADERHAEATWNNDLAVDSTNGTFTVYLEKRWGQAVLKFEAEGYRPESAVVRLQDQSNADFTLPAGAAPGGVVLQPDGQPATDAEVALVCEGPERPVCDQTGHLSCSARPELVIKTDATGHFAFGSELGMEALAAASPAGFSQVPLAQLATNPVIRLTAFGEITGVLQRPTGPGTNEEVRLALVAPVESTNCWVHATQSAVTDATGRFGFRSVPAGTVDITCENPLPTNPSQQVTVNPGLKVEMAIQAADRPVPPAAEVAPVTDLSRPTSRFPIPVLGVDVKGVVLSPDGHPALAAQVGLEVKRADTGGNSLRLNRAALDSGESWRDGLVVRTGPDGQFTLPMCEGAQSVLAVSEDGLGRVTLDALKRTPQIKLAPWGRVEGTLHMGRRLGRGEQVYLQDRWPASGANSLPPLLDFHNAAYLTKTDDQGRFVFNYVPPGETVAWRKLPKKGVQYLIGDPLSTVSVEPGETAQVDLMDDVHTVVGRMAMIDTSSLLDGQRRIVYLTTFTDEQDQLRRARTDAERQTIRQSPAFRTARSRIHEYIMKLEADGGFKLEDVVPGTYELSLQMYKPNYTSGPVELTYLIAPHQVVVPEGPNDDAVIDLGIVDFEPPTVPPLWR